MSNETFIIIMIIIISVLIGIHVKLYREDKQKAIRSLKLMATYCIVVFLSYSVASDYLPFPTKLIPILWFFPFKYFDYKNEQKYNKS